MDANRTSTFENARQFERELNGRQREILAMLAKGCTNAEIAEALDLTFSGAKWNVSEILSKLGLSSREEALEYWHWRQGIGSRAKSALRALVPAGMPKKLVAGGGFAAIAVVVAVVIFLVRGPSPPSDNTVSLPPFRMEVSILQRDPGSDFETLPRSSGSTRAQSNAVEKFACASSTTCRAVPPKVHHRICRPRRDGSGLQRQAGEL